MGIVDDESSHWVVNRIGGISIFSLLSLNIVTIVICAIFAAGAPSTTSENFLGLAMKAVNGILFLTAGAGVLCSVAFIVFDKFRSIGKMCLPWFLGFCVVTAISWGVIQALL
jgi:hypothetical protein